MRKTKIVCTIGPAVDSYKKTGELVRAGMNVARLNFSHGSKADFKRIIKNVRKAGRVNKRPVAVMQDLQGPKIRVGKMSAPLTLKKGSEVTIREGASGLQGEVPVDFKGLCDYVKPGDRMLINDGLVPLKVKKVDRRGKKIICAAIAGGVIEQKKGVNLPGVSLPPGAMTKKDRRDLRFGLLNGVDIVSLSFVRSAADIRELKAAMGKRKNMPIIVAKIEKPEALKDMDKIINEADGVMVARGDLAVEIGYGRIPFIQKKLIKRANEKGKLVIVATQMLESMTKNPYPERAEITDVYNAVVDGADCLMLSGETSVGKYPVKTVRVMSGIIKKAEKIRNKKYSPPLIIKSKMGVNNFLSYAAAMGPVFMEKAITAVRAEHVNDIAYISDYRPKNGVAVFTGDEKEYNRFALYNGVYPFLLKHEKEAIKGIKKNLRRFKYAVYVDFCPDREEGKLVVFNTGEKK